jgi:hypothetical protein
MLENDENAVRDVLTTINQIPPGRLPQSLRAQSMRARARLLIHRGEATDVETSLRGAIELFKDLKMRFWTAVTLLELGEWLIKQAREQEAGPLVEEAKEIFAALRAAPWLQRLAQLSLGSNMTA